MRSRFSLVAAASAALTSACSSAPRVPRSMPMAPVTATAPRGISDAVLGTPVDAHFRPLQGEIGRRIFRNARVTQLPQTYVSHETTTMRDTVSLDANFAAWSVADASLGFTTDNRYATYRAIQLVGVSSIDDTADMDEPPPEASFYVAKVYWGYSYEAVFEGNHRKFNADVSAKFGAFKAGVDTFAASNGLKAHFVGVGLRPKTPTAIFARDQRSILDAYDMAGPPAPILVEYRALPGRVLPQAFAIPFDPALAVTVRFADVRVLEDGTWFSTPWNLEARCGVGSAGDGFPTPLLRGDAVDKGRTYTLNQTIDLVAVPGDPVECTAGGTFADALKSGSIAPGRSAPVRIMGPGAFPITISGTGTASYVIDASVEVRPVN